MDIENLSESFWFTVGAYVCAILPWTVISSTDYISSSWRSVKDIRSAGYRDLVWAFLPMTYIIFYGFVQAKVGEYSEMCASAIAAVLAALLGLRTVWGLWQLHEFRKWAQRSIDALDSVGIEYSLHSFDKKSTTKLTSAQVSEQIFVNDKIVDNQIMHGDVHCFLKLGEAELLTSRDEDVTVLGPMLKVLRWIAFFGALALECIRRIFGKGAQKRLSQVPMKPVEVWVRWATTFASQGLQKWISEFEVPLDPNAYGYGVGKAARELMFERGRYFGAEVLASASLHLWSECGSGKGLSPMLWDVWDEQSEMSDGRVVKQELLRDAIEKGECLSFGASQKFELSSQDRKGSEVDYGYDGYYEVMKQFISELPVQSCFVKEMRKFDINMLEWLTIMLHLGTMSLKYGYATMGNDDHSKSEACAEGYRTRSRLCTNRSCGQTKDGKSFEERGKEAVKILCSQVSLNDRRTTEESQEGDKSGRLLDGRSAITSVPILKEVLSVSSKGNRLVTKVGQLVDIWASLISGDQIRFLSEELNSEWVDICLGKEEGERMRSPKCEEHEEWGIRRAHRELEKRRLERRTADASSRYRCMDLFITFMGYRMESVRTVIGRWVEMNAGKCGDDLFGEITPKAMHEISIDIELSEHLCFFIKQGKGVGSYRRRGFQCRLLWEVQNHLERRLNVKEEWEDENEESTMRVAAVMLFLLSFPGLKMDVQVSGNLQRVEESKEGCCIIFKGIEGQRRLERRTEEENGIRSEVNDYDSIVIDLRLVCGVQKMRIRAVIERCKTCVLQLVHDNDEEGFKWKWWREAFIGRLEGFSEWQREMELLDVPVENAREDWGHARSPMKKMPTEAKSTIKTWREWTPFRTQFCRFELESKDFLREARSVNIKSSSFLNDNEECMVEVGLLPIQSVISVCYDHAGERVLEDSCILVRGALAKDCDVRDLRERDDEEGAGAVKNDGELLVTLCEESEQSEMLMLNQITDVELGNIKGVKQTLETLCRRANNARNIRDVVLLLQSYIGRLLSSRSESVRIVKGREEEVELTVLPVCERIMRKLRRDEDDVEGVLKVLVTCLATDIKRHSQMVMKLMHRMLMFCSSSSSELLTELKLEKAISCFASPTTVQRHICFEKISTRAQYGKSISRECHRSRRAILEKIIARNGGPVISNHGNSMSEDKYCGPFQSYPGIQSVINGTIVNSGAKADAKEVQTRMRAITSLASLIVSGAEGVPADTVLGIRLYDALIEEGSWTFALYNLAVLFKNGAEGVSADPALAVKLYQRAIDEGHEVEAITNLASILRYGAEGVRADAGKAVKLYERAIAEGNDVKAMYNLAHLLTSGADGVEPDTARAIYWYEQAIEVGAYVPAMYNLAVLFETETAGVPRDIARAVKLYERAIEEGHDRAMNNLATILKNGVGGVRRDTSLAVKLYQRAIEEKGNVNSMYNLANTLAIGAKGVDINIAEAVRLYERAIETGSHVASMYNLAFLLETDREYMTADPARAVKLYERAIDEGHTESLFRLANLLLEGADDVLANVPRAIRLYERAIDEGHTESMFGLANLLLKGANDVLANVPRAIRLYERAIEEGNHEVAMFNLAHLFRFGKYGVAKNCTKAMKLYERAIEEKNDVDSMYSLGLLLQVGEEGVQPDVVRATMLYEKAIEAGSHVNSMHNLALTLTTGAKDIPANPIRAARLFERAIEEGSHAESMFQLANLFVMGVGVSKDFERAKKLYERAIENGNHVIAMRNLGRLLQSDAEGIVASPALSVKLYEGAIEEGNDVESMYYLAGLLQTGAKDVSADPSQAKSLLERAVEEGCHPRAMYSLGCLLEHGAEGVKKENARAAELYAMAIENDGGAAPKYALARLIMSGVHGVPVDARRAMELFLMVLTEVGEHTDTLLFVSALFATGAGEVQKDMEKAKDFLKRALRCENGVEDAERELGKLRKTFSECCNGGRDNELVREIEEAAQKWNIDLDRS